MEKSWPHFRPPPVDFCMIFRYFSLRNEETETRASVSNAATNAQDRAPEYSCNPVLLSIKSHSTAALVLDRKKLAAFSAAAGRFLRFPIGDRRGTRMRASVSKRPVTRAQALTNATLAAAGLLHRRSPTAPCL